MNGKFTAVTIKGESMKGLLDFLGTNVGKPERKRNKKKLKNNQDEYTVLDCDECEGKFKLKKCPFCGNAAAMIINDVPISLSPHRVSQKAVKCDCCSARASGVSTKDAVNKWNRREG